MKNYDWQSTIFVIILCFVVCFGMHKMTKIVDRYADKHYQKTYSKKGLK